MSSALWFWDKRAMFWNCTRCPKLSPLSGEVVIQCGTIWSPKGFDISRLCHSNLSRSEDHSFLESSAKKGSPAVNLLLYSLHPPTYVGKVGSGRSGVGWGGRKHNPWFFQSAYVIVNMYVSVFIILYVCASKICKISLLLFTFLCLLKFRFFKSRHNHTVHFIS